MTVYFDTCSLNRPLDDKTQLRIALEAEAILGLLAKCDAGELTLVTSEVLLIEVDRNPYPERKAFVSAILASAPVFILVDEDVEQRALVLEHRGFKGFDALHLAAAESARINWMCSCDDGLLKKARQQTDLTVKVVSPLELVSEVTS